VGHNGLSEDVVASVEAFLYGIHEVRHPLVEGLLEFLLLYSLMGTLHKHSNFITQIPVHQDDPLIDHKFLSFEFYLNGLQHLHTLKDVLQSICTECGTCDVMEHHQGFCGTLNLYSKIDPAHYNVCQFFKVLSAISS
jgi:hypothetical protein